MIFVFGLFVFLKLCLAIPTSFLRPPSLIPLLRISIPITAYTKVLVEFGLRTSFPIHCFFFHVGDKAPSDFKNDICVLLNLSFEEPHLFTAYFLHDNCCLVFCCSFFISMLGAFLKEVCVHAGLATNLKPDPFFQCSSLGSLLENSLY